MVHPSLAALLGVAEVAPVGLEEQLPRDGVPPVLMVLFAEWGKTYWMMVWSNCVSSSVQRGGRPCGLRRERAWNSKKTVLL
jgi:hypothetical protein